MRNPSLIFLLLLGCSPAAVTSTSIAPPPPPPAVPLVLAVTPGSRRATAQPGTAAPGDNAAIALTGDKASQAGWSATNRHGWLTMTGGTGTGSGTATWTRTTSGLAAGFYIDTITIVATGATGSPTLVIDTLQITAAPVPLTLVVSPLSRNRAATQGAPAPDDNVAITITGDNAATTGWTATSRKAWTQLVTTSGTGGGLLAWHRNAASLAVGTYVDTITVAAPGAVGSPMQVIDTLRITAAPVPLALFLTPTSRSIMIVQGATAAGSTAAITITGDNAATAGWTATKKKSWTTLSTASGTGSNILSWTRTTAALTAGTYVDTITVTVAGASGSPATVLDTIVVSSPTGGAGVPDLGINTSLHGKQLFPASDPWNTPIDNAPVDPNSAAILGPISGKSLHPDFGSDPSGQFGYSYAIVPDGTQRYSLNPLEVAGESDPGPYPIPANPPLEQGSDAHLIIITQNEWKLYEMDGLYNIAAGQWGAYSGAIFDLTFGTHRPNFWTSADAAGLPMFPGLVRYDEVYEQGAINHALRFTITHTRQAFVPPATHWASSSTDPTRAPMGMRVRLKANFDISSYPAPMQVILKALKKYGMMVADNGGDFFLSGATDPRWDNDMNNLLKQVHVSDFEVVQMNGLVSN